MSSITCGNDECDAEVECDLSALEVDESQKSGNHTTQHASSGEIECKVCGHINVVSCVWDELDDTGEVLSCECR